MKLTKSRLRQIIREEKSSINEAEGAVPNRQEIEDAVLQVWWSEGSVDLVDVFDFLKMVGWSEEQIRDGLDRIG